MGFENSKSLPLKSPAKIFVYIYVHGDKIFSGRFSLIKASNFQKLFSPFDSWVCGEQKSRSTKIFRNFEKFLYDPLETDSTETPDEENAPDESGDKEISENEQEKSDHGSEPDAEVEKFRIWRL